MKGLCDWCKNLGLLKRVDFYPRRMLCVSCRLTEYQRRRLNGARPRTVSKSQQPA